MENPSAEDDLKGLYDSLMASNLEPEKAKGIFLGMVTEVVSPMLYKAFQVAGLETDFSGRLEADNGDKYEVTFRKLDPDEYALPLNIYLVLAKPTIFVIAAPSEDVITEITGGRFTAASPLVGAYTRGMPRIITTFSMAELDANSPLRKNMYFVQVWDDASAIVAAHSEQEAKELADAPGSRKAYLIEHVSTFAPAGIVQSIPLEWK